jgi:ABC-type amino acid transport substrate-binding protein
VAGDPARLLLEQYPTLVLRNYESVPKMFDAVAAGEIEGAVFSQVPAVRYVHDLYQGVLKVGSSPLNSSGLHVIAMKGSSFVPAFNQALARLEKKKKLVPLLQKWQLNP